MKRLLALAAILVIVVVAVGLYRGWFSFTTAGDDHKVKIDVTVDKDKVKADEERAKEKLQKLGGQIKEEAEDLSQKAKKGISSKKPEGP